MNNKTNIIIVDDHPVFRRGLKDIIHEENSFKIIGEAGDGEEALQIILNMKPDIVVLDMDIPKLTGLEVLRKLKQASSHSKIIFLTMYKDEEFLHKALDQGASGYILKDSAMSEIVFGIRQVLEGEYYVSPFMTKFLINRRQKNEINKVERLDSLSPVEKRILFLVAEHKTSKEIANELLVSHRTVEKHRNNICKKLNISGAHALLKFAVENRSVI